MTASSEDLARVGGATPERPVTYREMIQVLTTVANEAEADYRAFGHPSRRERAQVFDAIQRVVLNHMQIRAHGGAGRGGFGR